VRLAIWKLNHEESDRPEAGFGDSRFRIVITMAIPEMLS